jgi:hypothetical protein
VPCRKHLVCCLSGFTDYALSKYTRIYMWLLVSLRSVVVKALCYNPEGCKFFSIYLILPATLGPGIYLASNRNEYQKQKNVSWEYSTASAQGWQPYCHLWADCLNNVGSLTSLNPIGLHSLLRDSCTYFPFHVSWLQCCFCGSHSSMFPYMTPHSCLFLITINPLLSCIVASCCTRLTFNIK